MKPRTLRPRATGAAAAALGLALVLLAGAVPSSRAQGWKSSPRRPAADGRTVPVAPIDPFRPERGGVYSNLGLLDRLTRDAVREIADSLDLPPGSEITILSTTWHEANWFVGGLLAESLKDRGYRVRTGDWGPPPDTAAMPAMARPGTAAGQGPQERSRPESDPRAPAPAGPDDEEERATAPGDTTATPPDSVETVTDPLWGDWIDEGGQRAAPAAAPEVRRAVAPLAGRRELPAGNVLDLRLLEFGVTYPQVGRKLLFGPVRFTRVGGVFAQVHSLVGPAGEFRQMVSAERHRVDRLGGSQRALVEGASFPFTPPSLQPPRLSRYIEPTVVVAIVGSLVYLFYANQK